MQEGRHPFAKLLVDRRLIEQTTKLSHEERPRDVISFAIRHEERIELVDQLVLDLVEMLVLLVLGDDHAVEDVNGIVAELVMMA